MTHVLPGLSAEDQQHIANAAMYGHINETYGTTGRWFATVENARDLAGYGISDMDADPDGLLGVVTL